MTQKQENKKICIFCERAITSKARGKKNIIYMIIPKPDWSKAPEWANYHTIDWNGGQCWFENIPGFDKDLRAWYPKGGEWDMVEYELCNLSLTPRPIEEKNQDASNQTR